MGPPLSTTVWHVSDNGAVITILPNGSKLEVVNPRDDLQVGDIITVDSDTIEFINLVSRTGYETGNSIGIVEEIHSDSIIANINGVMRKVSNPLNINIDEGWTVELSDAFTIVSVLAQYSISDDPLERDTSEAIDGFRQSSEDRESLDFDDFGGLTKQHEHLIRRTGLLLTERESLVNVGVEIQMGALFYGPPGTGKTHFARILASQLDATFYRVRGPEIISTWVGDTEKLIRDLFKDASERSPAIIFFDEIDSIAADRGGEGRQDFSQRLVAQLLSVIDGFDKEEHGVFLIAATNQRDEIDEALLRPGRFSWEVEFPKPDPGGRKAIISALTREDNGQFELSTSITTEDIDEIVQLTANWTGAHLKELLNEAGIICVEEGRTEIEYLDMRKGHERISEQMGESRQ